MYMYLLGNKKTYFLSSVSIHDYCFYKYALCPSNKLVAKHQHSCISSVGSYMSAGALQLLFMYLRYSIFNTALRGGRGMVSGCGGRDGEKCFT